MQLTICSSLNAGVKCLANAIVDTMQNENVVCLEQKVILGLNPAANRHPVGSHCLETFVGRE